MLITCSIQLFLVPLQHERLIFNFIFMDTRKEELTEYIEVLDHVINKMADSETSYENNFCYNVLKDIRDSFDFEKTIYESRPEDILDVDRAEVEKGIKEYINTKFPIIEGVGFNKLIENSLKHYYRIGLCEGYTEGRVVGEKIMHQLLSGEKGKSQLPR